MVLVAVASASLPSAAAAAEGVFYGYDERDRLTHVVSNGTEVVYAYDDVGNRFVVAVPEPGGPAPLAWGALLLAWLARQVRRGRPGGHGEKLATEPAAKAGKESSAVGRRSARLGAWGAGLLLMAVVLAPPGAAQTLPGFRTAQMPDPSLFLAGSPSAATAVSAAEAGSSLVATHPGSATEVTAELAVLARALKHDVDLIYEFVASEIDYNPIWGSHKGALGTLLDREGGDFEQASLMIALLRESGYEASYVYGQQRIAGADVINWLGVADDANVMSRWLSNSGRDPTRNDVLGVSGGQIDVVDMERVWVKVRIDGTDYVFDPAFKIHTIKPGIDVGAAMGYDRASLMAAAQAGATVTPNSVQNLNDANLGLTLSGFATNLAEVIRNDHLGGTIDDIVGGREIVPPSDSPRQTSLPGQRAVFEQWSGEIPAPFRACLRVALPGFDVTFNADAIAGRRLTIFYENNSPVLRLDDGQLRIEVVENGLPATPGSLQPLEIQVVHPFFDDHADQIGTIPIEVGGAYLVVNGWASTREGRVRHHELRQRSNSAIFPEGAFEGAFAEEAVLGESLAVFAASWMAQVEEARDLAAKLGDSHNFSYHTVGVASQVDSPSIDIPFSVRNVVSNSNDAVAEFGVFFAGTGHSSAFEGGVIEQLQPQFRAVSTVALTGVANDQSSTFFDVTAATFPSIQPQLVGYTPFDLTQVQAFLDEGSRILLPRNGNLVVDNWSGSGFLAVADLPGGVRSLSYIISGGLNGGSATTDGVLDPVSSFQSQSGDHLQSDDPIDLVTGDFLYDEVDLTVGSQPFPLGLAFKKSYNSGARHRNGPLGFGWTHNFDLDAMPGSNGFQAFGKDSPLDAVAAIAEMFVSIDLLSGGPSAPVSELIVAMLAQRWFMEQLTDNIVTVRQPDRTSVFVRLPDGSFSPPPGSALKLFEEPDGRVWLTTKEGSRLHFRPDGQISASVDRNGNTVTFTYSSEKLVRVDDAAGHHFAFTYEGDRISSVSDGTRSVSYGYDSHFGTVPSLKTVTNAENVVTEFTYLWDRFILNFGGPGYTTSHPIYKNAIFAALESVFTPANPTNMRVFNTYDDLGHITGQTDANGNVWTYHIAGSRSEEIDPTGASKVAYYNDRERAVREIDALGFETLTEYDGENRVVLEIEPEGNFSQFEYDDRHNLTRATAFPKPGSPLAPIIREMTYEPVFNRVTSETDPRGGVTRFSYDDFGNLTRLEQPTALGQSPVTTFTYNGRGQMLTQTDAEGTVTEFSYDPATADLLTRTDDVGGLHVLTSMTYDDFGNVTSVTDPRGNRAIFTLDFMRRVVRTQAPAPFNFVTRLKYDEEGHLTLQERQMGDPAPWQTTAMSYTLSGKLETATDPGQQTTTTTYDLLDRVASQVDALGRTTQFLYTPRGNLERTLDPTGQPSKILTYTPNGQVASVTDANGHTTTFEYDGFDRLDRTVFANGTFEQLAYDAASNVVSKRLRSGQSILFQYDALGRMLSKLPPDDFVIIFGYDRMGRLTSEFQAGGVTTFQYDALGRLIAKTDRNSRTVAYQYDGAGNRIRLTYPNGHFITYEYDELNRLRRIREAGVTEIVAYGYDSLSRRTSTTRRNGTSTTRVWELDDDLGSLTHQLPGGPATWTYGYDAVHNRTSTSISAAQFNCKCSPYPVTNRDRGTEAVWP
jgi:YD repeat-containing protein